MWSLDQPGLAGINLRHASLKEAFLTNTSLVEADLRGADLTGAVLIDTRIYGADLTGAILTEANLSQVNLSKAKLIGVTARGAHFVHSIMTGTQLQGADCSRADLSYARFLDANLSGTIFQESDLTGASLISVDVSGASFSGARVFGLSAWNLAGVPKSMNALIITPEGEPTVIVDDLEVAQFIYLLLKHENLRRVLNSVTERGVLLLGRFGGGGIEILQAIARRLRDLKYLPMIFDFQRPDSRNYTETVKTLTGLSRFVIVDLSGPSVPQELYATVPHYKIPFVPIIEKGARPYAMFADILEYDWVLKPIVEFDSIDALLKVLPAQVIEPAERKHEARQALLHELFSRAG